MCIYNHIYIHIYTRNPDDHRLWDGFQTTVNLLSFFRDSTKIEAEWLREHNAAWVNRCQSLSLQPMLDVLMRTAQLFRLKLMKAKWGTFCHRRIDLLWLMTCKSSLEVFGTPCGCFQWFQLCSGLTLPSQICFPKHRACLNGTATWPPGTCNLSPPGLVWCQRTSKIACRRAADFGEEIIETPPCGDGHLRRRARIWRSWASTFR